jgi:transposase
MEPGKETNKPQNHGRYPDEMRERVIRMVKDQREQYPSEKGAIASIASKMGIHPDTVRTWVRRDEVDHGEREGMTTDERALLVKLTRENKELRRANEILKAASAFFARELDPTTRMQ